MGGRCAVMAALVTWAGLLVAASMSASGTAPACLAASVLLWLAWRAPPRTATLAVLLALALAAGARGAMCRERIERAQATAGAPEVPEWIRARVLGHPWRESGTPVALIDVEAPRWPRGTRARVRLPPDCAAEWGDRLDALAMLEPPAGLRNPGGFAARDAARASGVSATGRVLAVRRLDRSRGWQNATLVRWRRAMEAALHRGVEPETRELVLPLVLGDRSGLSADLGADLRASGLTHLLALSGLHVTWLAAAARGVVAALGFGPRGRAVAGVAAALLYMGLAGPLPSLVRAAVTECLIGAARLLGRAMDPVQALAVTALALLAVAPGWAEDLGFQLSCVATLGLVTVGAWLTRLASPPGRRRALQSALRALLGVLIPTLSAQLLALPLLLGRFHAVAWTALAANLAGVPVCGLLLAAAWLGALLELAWPGAGAPCFSACDALAAVLRLTAGGAAAIPNAMLTTGAAPAVPWLAGAGAALLAATLGARREREQPAVSRGRFLALGLGGLAVALALVLALTTRPLAPPAGRWWLVVLDVGQGDALALGFEREWWLVDAGPRSERFDAGQSIVVPFLLWAGVRRVGSVVLTHAHGDHTGGARAVLRALPVMRRLAPVPLPGVPGPSRDFAARPLARGDTLGRRPFVKVLWPPEGARLRNDNAASLVLEVGTGAGRALLAADVDSTVEESLAVQVNVGALKVGHHGSATSSGAGFLARIKSSVAVVSAGRRNPFGHPDPGAMARLETAGSRVLRTDREGAVWLELSEQGVHRVDWRRGPPAPLEILAPLRRGPWP
ncbi:MAG TPA: DNA internalization-related competence protein ComEC/Rec2 [Candidatus Limnocylindria bacterium]|nr:DNA internalization-related competence protein ComEC/Rec2 [Candidatus Limnocylindria bacterium]